MIKIKNPCNINGKRYEIGEEFKPKKSDMPLIIRMNEDGFIEPLTKEELLIIFKNFNLKRNRKKEV